MFNKLKQLPPVYFIGAGFAAILIIIGVVLFLNPVKNPTGANTTSNGEYYDAKSGETVSDPAGKAPDTYGTAEQPIYLGFSTLLSSGLSKYQLAAVKSALVQYSKSSQKNFKEFSLDVSSVKTISPNQDDADPKSTVSFALTADRKISFGARFEYTDINSMRLYLKDENGSQVFDSQVIDGSDLSGSTD